VLHDKYLPVYHFNEKHFILISATPERVYSVLSEFNFSDSRIIKVLFKLRGLPTRAYQGLRGMEEMGFTLLEQQPENEIMLGLVGQFWKLRGNIQRCEPSEFTEGQPGFARATWNFEIKWVNNQEVMLETEKRIACGDEASRKRFARYWFFIRPFSGIIRKEILKSIKRKAESS
jgi:hypothetical protein